MGSQVAIALLIIVGICHAARLDNIYLPPGSAGSAGGPGLIHPPGPGGGGPIKLSSPLSGSGDLGGPGGHGGPDSHGGPSGFGPSGDSGIYQGGRLADDGHGDQKIPILSYSNENAGDGNYEFSYETGNGITVQETGHQQGESEAVSGSFSYTGPDGVQYSVTYTADENGFHPQGAHLPTPPPIPPEIQRGVELALAAEARGENQDGGGGGYSHGEGGYSSGGGSHGGHGSDAYQGLNSYQTSSAGGYQY
ncbi:pupal cuticle protein 20-like [Nylanderia fulva]|uniref:pupal cuticle protein 20-like n=1 Tax=Nylanderia fulva TaxID=613905 RepID=UPI0010FB7675|nr:pupal cuticle protein 20-like [Nylanderia fulva]XP_029158862.1 pupal cuticle protein 20-like [Nylanderia fulva]XP_029158863.1 pupal cuticle protein 20-like [Nylanderia fulva]